MKDALTVEQQRSLVERERQRMSEPDYRDILESPSPDMIPKRQRCSLRMIYRYLRQGRGRS